MKLELLLSEEQFKRVIKLVYLGNFVVNSIRGDEDNERIKEYDEIENIFLKLAYKEGLTVLSEFDKSEGKYYPSEDLEYDDEVMSFVEDFVEENFWNELCSRLAQRDVSEQFGEQEDDSLPTEEEFNMFLDTMEKYSSEFEDNGIQNLRIIKEDDE